jgi:hypothetical protein
MQRHGTSQTFTRNVGNLLGSQSGDRIDPEWLPKPERAGGGHRTRSENHALG